jgi:hypothetical protein
MYPIAMILLTECYRFEQDQLTSIVFVDSFDQMGPEAFADSPVNDPDEEQGPDVQLGSETVHLETGQAHV